MVSFRCKERLREELGKLGIVPNIDRGTIEFHEKLSAQQIFQLKEAIWELGFEILDDRKSYLLDHISEAIEMLIRLNTKKWGTDYPEYLAEKMRFNREEVSKLYLQVYGMSLPRYVEIQQIERAKEIMLLYEELTIKEVAEMSRYEELEQFVTSFKDNTGLEPRHYRKIKRKQTEIKLEGNFESDGISAFTATEKNIFTSYRDSNWKVR